MSVRKHVVAGFNISCVGDERCYSFLPSREGNTLSDRVARYVLQRIDPNYKRYSFLERGSDERQYCAPGVDLPVCSIMRSKFSCYPEYHTSADDLSFVTARGLHGTYVALKNCLEIIEANSVWRATVLCEPQLGKRGLYPTTSTRESGLSVRTMMNLLAYADGRHDLLDVVDLIGAEFAECAEIAEKLAKHGLLEIVGS